MTAGQVSPYKGLSDIELADQFVHMFEKLKNLKKDLDSRGLLISYANVYNVHAGMPKHIHNWPELVIREITKTKILYENSVPGL